MEDIKATSPFLFVLQQFITSKQMFKRGMAVLYVQKPLWHNELMSLLAGWQAKLSNYLTGWQGKGDSLETAASFILSA